MLLPPSEWPLKKRTGYFSVCAPTNPPPANALKDVRSYWTKVHEICYRDWKSHPFCDPPNSCRMRAQRREWRRGMSIFANTRHKSVTIATSLERAVAIIIFCYEANLPPLYFLNVWRRLTQALWWKHQKRAYFGHVCINPLMQMRNKISEYWTSSWNFCQT